MKFSDDVPDYFVADDSEGTNPVADSNAIDFSSESLPTEKPTEEPRRPHHRLRKVLIWTIVIGVVILAGAFYLRYCSPYATDAQLTGYVLSVEKRGLIFKTWEADFISLEALNHGQNNYDRKYSFSVTDPAIAEQLRRYQGKHEPVKVDFSRYYATLPWRGASTSVITAIDSVSEQQE